MGGNRLGSSRAGSVGSFMITETVCWQGRGLCGIDVCGHTQDEVGMRGEITSPEALTVSHGQGLMQVRPLRSHGALNSKRACACFSALPYLLHQTTHIPFCSPSSDSSDHPQYAFLIPSDNVLIKYQVLSDQPLKYLL